MIKKLGLIWALLTLIGCSSPGKDIKKLIHKGMDKSAVLEELGNPSRSKRVKGADRWSYDEYVGDKKQVTHVYFKNGKVSYVGRDDQLVKELKELSRQKKTYPKKSKSEPQKFRDL